MRGLVFLGEREVELREFPEPTPGPRDVLIRIAASGMCGSDLHSYRAPRLNGLSSYFQRADGGACVQGHEPCGIVVERGAAVPQSIAPIGQRVMTHHYSGCGT